MKYIALLLLFTLFLGIAPSVEASSCRNYNDHLICILSIKRSAKYNWEYRAAVSVDGVKKPIEIYNCRNRVRIQKDRTVVPLEQDGAGEFICSLLKK